MVKSPFFPQVLAINSILTTPHCLSTPSSGCTVDCTLLVVPSAQSCPLMPSPAVQTASSSSSPAPPDVRDGSPSLPTSPSLSYTSSPSSPSLPGRRSRSLLRSHLLSLVRAGPLAPRITSLLSLLLRIPSTSAVTSRAGPSDGGKLPYEALGDALPETDPVRREGPRFNPLGRGREWEGEGEDEEGVGVDISAPAEVAAT